MALHQQQHPVPFDVSLPVSWASLPLSDGNGIFIPRPLQQTKEMQKNSQLNILNVILAAGRPVENLQYPVSVDPI